MEIEIDDILEDAENEKNKKKRVNSNAKGKRYERAGAKLLKERFGFEFSRTLGSGNRWSQTSYLPAHAQKTFTGDLVCPENFLFVMEIKGGYDDIDLHTALSKGSQAMIDKWIKQSQDESDRSGLKPLICWKKSRKEWLGIIKKEDAKKINAPIFMEYNGWLIMPLSDILAMKDEFFFSDD